MSAFDLPSPVTKNPLELFAQLLSEAEATSSKTEKVDIVAKYAVSIDSAVSDLLLRSLSPMITYGVAKLPASPDYRAPSAGFDIYAVGLRLLDNLASRTLTGNAAQEAISTFLAFVPDVAPITGSVTLREAFRRILLKDLRAGFGDSTVNKAVKGLIPVFPYMRCSLIKDVKLDSWPWESGVVSQEKADGMFANMDVEAGGLVQLSSRQGTQFPMDPFADLASEAQARLTPGLQYHGELLVERNGAVLPREQSNGILNHVVQGGSFAAGDRPVYLLWDGIPLTAIKPKGKYEVKFSARLAGLMARLAASQAPGQAISLIETRIVNSLEDAYSHYRELLAKGKEGTIIKHPGAIWRDGTSKEQVKLKLEVDVDLEITGFTEGNGKNADTFGSITTKTSDGLLVVDVSGFTDAKRKELHDNRQDVIGKIMTVRANSIMTPQNGNDPHSLFLPRYVEIRTDKSEADSLARVKVQFESAIRG